MLLKPHNVKGDKAQLGRQGECESQVCKLPPPSLPLLAAAALPGENPAACTGAGRAETQGLQCTRLAGPQWSGDSFILLSHLDVPGPFGGRPPCTHPAGVPASHLPSPDPRGNHSSLAEHNLLSQARSSAKSCPKEITPRLLIYNY